MTGSIWLPAGFFVALVAIANHVEVVQAPLSADLYLATAMATVVVPCIAVGIVLLSYGLAVRTKPGSRPPVRSLGPQQGR